MSIDYKVQPSSTFKWGLVFKVLWSEPRGNRGTGSDSGETEYSERESKYGQKIHQKVRRFIVIESQAGHSICLSILTYGGQGVMKAGVHAKDHAVVYSHGNHPSFAAGEFEKGLTRDPICVKHSSKRHILDKMSRVNYAKLYTVEHNVKIWLIGQVHSRSEHTLVSNYNAVHPPMANRGVPPAMVNQDDQPAQQNFNPSLGYSGPSGPSSGYLAPSLGFTPRYSGYDSRADTSFDSSGGTTAYSAPPFTSGEMATYQIDQAQTTYQSYQAQTMASSSVNTVTYPTIAPASSLHMPEKSYVEERRRRR